jgi:hypothetical protein
MRYAKLWAALAAAVGVGVAVTADGSISMNDGFAIAAAFLGSFGVYAATNTLPPDPEPVPPPFAPPPKP